MNVILKLSQDQVEKYGIKSVEDLVKLLEKPEPASTSPQTSTPKVDEQPAAKAPEATAESKVPAVAIESVAAVAPAIPAEEPKAEIAAIRKELEAFKQTFKAELANQVATALAEATAQLGTAPLMVTGSKAAPSTRDEIIAAYNAITNPTEAGKFYHEHKAVIDGKAGK